MWNTGKFPKNLTLSTKFTLAIGFILLTFCVIFSFLIYLHLKNRIIEDANEKTLIIMAQISAVGDYIKHTLRPKMFEILPNVDNKDEFVVEAMSTTKQKGGSGRAIAADIAFKACCGQYGQVGETNT